MLARNLQGPWGRLIGVPAIKYAYGTHLNEARRRQLGLIEPPRNGAGYRIYGPEELQRLRTLRALLDRHGLGPSDVAFAKRMRDESELEDAVARWLAEKAEKPEDVHASDWLDYEQQKHQKLLAA